MKPSFVAAALFLVCASCVGAVSANLDLFLLNSPNPAGAVCLDGTAPGYYFEPATSDAHKNDWVLFVAGGGWCYEEWDCAARANTTLGSSTNWGSSLVGNGPLSRDCSLNPTFCEYNFVYIAYCDGASFSGNVDAPVSVGSQTLYFRGHRVLTAVVNDLLSSRGLSTAARVLMSGCSAGGLTTFLHADYVGSLLPPSVQQFGAMPGSGYFLLTDTVEGKPVYPNEMSYVYSMQNTSGSLSSECQSALGHTGESWKCIFAQYAYKYLKTPSFIVNSAYDSWQASCIFTSEPVPQNSTANGSCGSASGWSSCVHNVTSCSASEADTLTKYSKDMISDLNSSGTFHAWGNGAFIHSCYSHCLFYGSAWGRVEIAGVKMNTAVDQWWNNVDSSKRYLPCEWDPDQPNGCNPTC